MPKQEMPVYEVGPEESADPASNPRPGAARSAERGRSRAVEPERDSIRSRSEHMPDLPLWDVCSSQNGPLGASRSRRWIVSDVLAHGGFAGALRTWLRRQDTSLASR